MGENWGTYQRQTRRPRIALPTGAVDCQAHVYGPIERYPIRHTSPYTPPPASIGDLLAMHAALGVQRGLLVQAASYGTDHSLLVDILAAQQGRFFGSCVMDTEWPTRELARLDDAGVRAARFALAPFLRTNWTIDDVVRGAAIAHETGWFIKVLAMPDQILANIDALRGIQAVCLLDHMGYLDPSAGLDQPAADAIASLLDSGNWWVMLSCGDRLSKAGRPWPDSAELIAHFARRWPDRVVWGSDWPHALYAGTVPNDAETADLVSGALDGPEARQRVFVDNPNALFTRARR